MLTRIISFCLCHRLFILMLMTLITGLGIYSALTLNTDAFPDVTGVQVEVISKLPGRSPLEMEKFVSTPVELAMKGLPGLTLIRSLSKFGISIVTVVFEDHMDIYFARQQVLERLIEAKESLPEGAEASLGPVATAMGEIYQYTIEDSRKIRGTRESLTELRTLQDWVIAPVLKNVPGVNEIDPFGGYIKQYQVSVTPEKLIEFNLSAKDICTAIYENNSNVGGSFIEQGSDQLIIRGVGLLESVSDIEHIPLKSEDGAMVLLGDIAMVSEGQAVRNGAGLINGEEEAVGASVLMLRDCNSRQVVSEVKKKIREINESDLLPEGISIKAFYDRSGIVREASHTLGEALGEGIALIILIIYFFLRGFRGAWVIISALLLSILTTAIIMKQAGMTANLMTLGGLIISLGMIIDSAIIQTENVQRHLEDMKDEKLGTVLCAVIEVRKPSILGELIIAITFLPILALEGMEGKMFSPLAVAVFITLMASLLLSIFVIPVICYYMLVPREEIDPLRVLKKLYLGLLEKALQRPLVVILPALILLIVSIASAPLLGTEFFPIMDEGAFDMDMVLPSGTSLTASIATNKKVQKVAKEFPELETIVSRIGWSGIGLDAKDADATFSVGELRPRREWKNAKTRETLIEKMRDRLATVPGVLVSFSQPIQCRINELVAGTKAQIVIKIFGDEIAILSEKADEIAEVISGVRGTEDLIVEQIAGQQYINIRINRQRIAQYGINVSDVQDIIEIALGGKPASKLYEENRYFDIVVRSAEENRRDLEAIGNLLVDVPGEEMKLPLREVADITVEGGPVQVSHEAGQRKVMLTCNVHGRDIGGFVKECKRSIKDKVSLPTGYFLDWGGQFENQQRAFKKLSIIIPVTVGIIFLLLFFTFESVTMASFVMLTLPFALIGGILALFISGSYLSVPASIGFIALFGIAVLNGVVLVSYINQLQGCGMDVHNAIVNGCKTRLRPVLMTASIAVFSLMPLLFSTGPGSEVQRPLAIVVVGGLITSTLMTLLVLPALYKLFIKK